MVQAVPVAVLAMRKKGGTTATERLGAAAVRVAERP